MTTQLHRLNATEETYIIKKGWGVLEIDGEKSELKRVMLLLFQPAPLKGFQMLVTKTLSSTAYARPVFHQNAMKI